MNLSFDYYHNLENPDFYLCNPDGRELFVITGFDRTLTLRFNDLSELAFSCYSTADAYDYIETRRLVFVTDIGWFVITNVQENNDGTTRYKSVTCSSLQATLKDRGFYCEEKVYYLYNPSDPYDANYDADDDSSVPSVVGQLYQQLGIKQDLAQGLSDPATPYSDWTITYINEGFFEKGRNFSETTEYAYEWIVNDVEEAFELIVLFDFYNKTIHLMSPGEIAAKANIVYSYCNFMKEVEITEDSEDIVTVMNCSGEDCDISTVNPTGTNYICDFSYYMDSEGRWMSSDLKNKLTAWQAAVDNVKDEYSSKVLELRASYDGLNSVNSALTEISQIYTDLTAAVAKKSVASTSDSSEDTLTGIVWCETVNIGETSMDEKSVTFTSSLENILQITAYKNMPTYDVDNRKWTLSGDCYTGTIDECFSYTDSSNTQYLYFIDNSEGNSGTSYCVLQGTAKINKTTFETDYVCSGYKRYVDLSHANAWMAKYDSKKIDLQAQKHSYESASTKKEEELQSIASSVNIVNYFSDSPALLKELYCYWIEGDYTNENISVGENTTQAEAIDLANELLDSGKVELSKVCQPKLQFSLTSADCTRQYEFREQMKELELGKIITIEAEEGVWYYPALLEIEYSLDEADTFSLQFANALRLDDWGYTYGDLMSDASSTSRQVSANWQNIISYSRNKEEISSLLKDPLSSTLRASFANMNNQEFMIDETGILGRKFTTASKTSFNDEQMRIINNVILFTDDNWETAKAALGKISYTDDNGQSVSAYGLIGDTIVGSLLMGEKLSIKNSDSSVILDGKGISIKNKDATVLSADTSGNLTVRGTVYATGGSIGGCLISNGVLQIPAAQITGALTIGSGTSIAGWTVGDDSIWTGLAGLSKSSSYTKESLVTSGSTSPVRIYCGSGNRIDGSFVVLDDGSLYASAAQISGKITATEGVFENGCKIGSSTYGFTISQGGDNTTCLYTRENSFSGMGGYGSSTAADVSVYIGGDGLSYWLNDSASTYDYNTAIRPGGVFCSGDNNGNQVQNRGILHGSGEIDFYYGGSTNLRTCDFAALQKLQVAGLEVRSSGLYLTGNWTGNSSGSIISDRTYKHDITDISEKYSTMFDSLCPRLYKYNDGTSGRTHVGFIAQELKSAMDSSDIDTSEFAAYVSSTDANGNTVLSIRYEEFTALNSWEIQKLKKRVAELETLVAELQKKE
jgi:hypothetical protein